MIRRLKRSDQSTPCERNPFFAVQPDQPLPIGLVFILAAIHAGLLAAITCLFFLMRGWVL